LEQLTRTIRQSTTQIACFFTLAQAAINQESPIQDIGRHVASVGSAVFTFVERNFYQ
jgi:hypothetical protein